MCCAQKVKKWPLLRTPPHVGAPACLRMGEIRRWVYAYFLQFRIVHAQQSIGFDFRFILVLFTVSFHVLIEIFRERFQLLSWPPFLATFVGEMLPPVGGNSFRDGK